MPERDAVQRPPWWKGARGEWLVVGQLALVVLVSFGPRTRDGWPVWPSLLPGAWTVAGTALMLAGGSLLFAGIFRIGPGLTSLPYPRDDAGLGQTGPYAIVRHPMYSGGLVLALGWALFVRGWLTLLYVCLLFAYLDAKSRREERLLSARYPAHAAYRQRVRKLIPSVY